MCFEIIHPSKRRNKYKKQFFTEFSEPSNEHCDKDCVSGDLYTYVLKKASNDSLSSLLYTSGYYNNNNDFFIRTYRKIFR